MNTNSSILGIALVALGLSLPACSSEEPDENPNPQQSELTGADVFTCADDDLQFFGAFRGPGYDEMNGGLQEPLQDTYLASATVISIKADEEAKKRFFQLSGALVMQLPKQEGIVAYQLATSEKCGYGRTITAWRSEEAMMGFVMSDAHIAAMSEATSVSDAAVVTSWEIAAAEMPFSWEEARARTNATKISYGDAAR